MSLNLKGLRTFHLIVREGSLAAAAREMNLSQPAASRLIALLEAETKLQLFSRARRRLVLTPEGEKFYREAKHILDGIDEIPQIVSDIQKQSNADLRVMTSVPIGLCLVAPALSLLMAAHPEIRCVADIGSRFDLESRVGTRRFDLGIVSLPISHSLVELDNEPLCRARTQVLLPAGHAYAKKPAITAEDLDGEPMIVLRPSQLWRQRVDDFFSAGGVTPTYRLETQSTLMARQLVVNGAGIAMMDRIVGGRVTDHSAILRPVDPERWVSYGYVFPKGRPRHPNADLFIDALRRVIDDLRAQNREDAVSIEPISA